VLRDINREGNTSVSISIPPVMRGGCPGQQEGKYRRGVGATCRKTFDSRSTQRNTFWRPKLFAPIVELPSRKTNRLIPVRAEVYDMTRFHCYRCADATIGNAVVWRKRQIRAACFADSDIA